MRRRLPGSSRLEGWCNRGRSGKGEMGEVLHNARVLSAARLHQVWHTANMAGIVPSGVRDVRHTECGLSATAGCVKAPPVKKFDTFGLYLREGTNRKCQIS